ncbi:SusC/RagA family TonB-linked outer membrane protein [Marinimicrobium alkaliphilum]|uniref:SusC/RagA family TonB-linked outer membrane protein n=1 Tax=Marinimicrobium alkaliphilum TaxID=2202654 RepID=UPI0018E0843B|nr:SusC/RagA family TonB-linked outer membrane protein [Marinimicrobium alkaliphilum]
MKKSVFLMSALACAISSVHAQAPDELQEEAVSGGQATASGDTAEPRLLEDILVTGYSVVEARNITGAASRVDMSEIEDIPSANVMESLQGRIPGVFITTDGNPNSTATVRIRGQGLGPLGNNDPLYVIDGVPTTAGMHELNPNDIESVQVLRDASTASIYGARAANGVIVITTKRGTRDRVTFNLSADQSFDSFSYDVNPLNSQQRARAIWQASVNDRIDPNTVSSLYTYDWNRDFDNPELSGVRLGDEDGYIDGARTMRAANTDWFSLVTQPAKVTNVNASVTGGGENSRVYTSIGYTDREGVVEGSRFDRLSFTVNSDYDFMDGRLTVGENFTITNQRQNIVNDRASEIVGLSLEQQSIVPVRTVDGQGWGGPTGGITDRDNPVRIIEMTRDNNLQYNRAIGSVYVEYQPIDNLTLRSNYGVNYSNFYLRNYRRAFQAGSLRGDDLLTTENAWNRTLVWSNTAEYQFGLGDNHNFTVLGGTETVEFKAENFVGIGQEFASDDRDFAFLSQATSGRQVGGGGDEWSMQSYFTKLDYDYDDRYLGSVTLRRDGSSRFGENNRWGNFPAVSAGWRLGQEEFFNVDFVDELMFRASWGQTGNQEINTRATSTVFEPRYATQTLFTAEQDEGTAYDLNGSGSGNLPSGFARVSTGNPDLKWETSVQTNVGVDFTLFDYRLYGSFDWFTKETKDILTTTQPLAVEGEGAQMVVNGGTIENEGFEVVLGYSNDFEIERWGIFTYDISANLSRATNTVVDLPDEVVNSFPGDGRDNTILGRSVNSFYGYVADGLFQSQEEVDDHASQSGAGPGRIRYRDVNGDGVIDEADQVFFGVPEPDYIYGVNFTLNYNEWDFGMFWQGVQGGMVNTGFQHLTDFVSLNAGSNYGDRVLDSWSPENANSTIPALTLADNNNEGRASTYFYEDASYLKLRNLSLGYTPGPDFWSRLGAQGGRFYIQGSNLLTITPSSTISKDPEAPGAAFPIPRRLTIGLNVNF